MANNNYDFRRLNLPAIDINDAYNTVNDQVTEMVSSITAVNDAVTNIPWDGVSQQDMEAVWDRWVKAITNLLGTQDDPSKGSINIVLTSLFQAAGNYSTAEQQLEAAFKQMQADIYSAGAAPSSPKTVLVQYENNDLNAPSTFVEEIYSD
jgi:uncharacterized protein YukE